MEVPDDRVVTVVPDPLPRVVASVVTGPGRAGPSASGLLLAVASAAAFGLAGPFAKALLDAGWSTAAVALVRNSVGALVLLPWSVSALRRVRPSRRDLGTIVVFGLLAVAGIQVLFLEAVDRLDVGVALLTEYLAPVLLVGWGWLRTRRTPGAGTLVGAGVALGGMALVVDVTTTFRTGGGSVDPVGLGFGLAAAVGLACYFAIGARATRVPAVALAGGGLVVGSAALAVLGAVGVLDLAAATRDAVLVGAPVAWWVPVAVLGVVACAVAYAAGTSASARLGERIASFAGLTEVLFAVLTAWIVLGEVPTPVQAVGGTLVLGGLVLVRRDRGTAAGDVRRDPSGAATPA